MISGGDKLRKSSCRIGYPIKETEFLLSIQTNHCENHQKFEYEGFIEYFYCIRIKFVNFFSCRGVPDPKFCFHTYVLIASKVRI